jgi:DNA-binding response OmpR family regulator
MARPASTAGEVIAADDEPEIRELLAEYLGRHGYSVRTADGGAQLRALLAQKPADDHLTKPFDLRELLARVKAVLRRTRRPSAGTGGARRSGYVFVPAEG